MTDPTPSTSSRVGPFRRLYDWILSLADRPRGTWALFIVSFTESSFFPIPPDPLLWALCLARPKRSIWFGFVCSLGSVLGGMAGYLIGSTVWEQIRVFCYDWIPGLNPEAERRFSEAYDADGFLIVFLAGFTPIPYKVITILSGAIGMNFGVFCVASAVGRGARFFLGAALIRMFGSSIRSFIDRYFNVLSLIFGAVLIIGFIIVRYCI